MNKSIKVTLGDCNIERKALNKMLWEIKNMTRKASNEAMRMYYIWENEKHKVKQETGRYPDEKDIYGVIYRNVVERNMKEIMDTCNTMNVGTTNQLILKKFNNDKKDIFLGKKSIANFKNNLPIDIHNDNYKFNIDENKKYKVQISLFTQEYKKENNIKKVEFTLDKLDKSQKAIINRIINKEYKLSAGEITEDKKKKGKWYLKIGYGFEPQKDKTLDENKVMGVDLGITKVATMSIYNINESTYDFIKWQKRYIDGKELIHYRQKIEARRKDLSIASKWCGEGRCGHGYNTRMKPVLDIGDKYSRFKDTYNHKISKYIVGLAKEYKCGTIQMENLSGFSEAQSESLLKNWSYHDLQTKIEYKAEEIGIKVIFINPQYTSKRCSECGNIHKENRDGKKNQAKFKCIVCGHEEDADINASKNIAIPHIDTIIKEYIKESKKKVS